MWEYNNEKPHSVYQYREQQYRTHISIKRLIYLYCAISMWFSVRNVVVAELRILCNWIFIVFYEMSAWMRV